VKALSLPQGEEQMLRTAAKKVAWVGRTASMVFGLALVLALLFGVASMALAGTGAGGVFNLGVTNTVSAVTELVSDAGTGPSGPMLRIDNNSTNTAATALDLQVEDGKVPMKVNRTTKVTNLNADLLDGLNSTVFVQGGGKVSRFGSVKMNNGDPLRTLIDAGPLALEGECSTSPSDIKITAVQLRNDGGGPVSWAVQSSDGVQVDDAAAAESFTKTYIALKKGVTGISGSVSGYAHHLGTNQQIFFEFYFYRVTNVFGDQSCTYGGYVVA
jgi:hypothetical protein